jgi:hypothetical protein
MQSQSFFPNNNVGASILPSEMSNTLNANQEKGERGINDNKE